MNEWKTMVRKKCKKCGAQMECWTYVDQDAESLEKIYSEQWICSFNPNHTA